MLTYEEQEAEREYWKQKRWEEQHDKNFFRGVVKVENGIEVEYHYAGGHLMGKYEKKTGRMVK